MFENFGVEEFSSHQISQDDLELEFSKMRTANGPNKNPHPSLFMATFRNQAVQEAGRPSKFGNVGITTNEDLISAKEFKDVWKDTEDNPETEEEDFNFGENIDIENLPGFESFDRLQAVSSQYVLGYCSRFIIHDMCRNNFAASDTDDRNLKMNAHIRNKDSAESRMAYPNLDAYELGRSMVILFKTEFRNYLSKTPKNIRHALCQQVPYSKFEDILCSECFEIVKDKFFLVMISCEIRKINNDVSFQFKELAQKNIKKINVQIFEKD